MSGTGVVQPQDEFPRRRRVHHKKSASDTWAFTASELLQKLPADGIPTRPGFPRGMAAVGETGYPAEEGSALPMGMGVHILPDFFPDHWGSDDELEGTTLTPAAAAPSQAPRSGKLARRLSSEHEDGNIVEKQRQAKQLDATMPRGGIRGASFCVSSGSGLKREGAEAAIPSESEGPAPPRHVRNRSDSMLSLPSSLVVEKPLSEFAGQTRANALDPSQLDPKRAKRIIANRQSAHRSRMKKLQVIHDLEQQVAVAGTTTDNLRQWVADAAAKRREHLLAAAATQQEIRSLSQELARAQYIQNALLEELGRLGITAPAFAAPGAPAPPPAAAGAATDRPAAALAAPAASPPPLPPKPPPPPATAAVTAAPAPPFTSAADISPPSLIFPSLDAAAAKQLPQPQAAAASEAAVLPSRTASVPVPTASCLPPRPTPGSGSSFSFGDRAPPSFSGFPVLRPFMPGAPQASPGITSPFLSPSPATGILGGLYRPPPPQEQRQHNPQTKTEGQEGQSGPQTPFFQAPHLPLQHQPPPLGSAGAGVGSGQQSPFLQPRSSLLAPAHAVAGSSNSLTSLGGGPSVTSVGPGVSGATSISEQAVPGAMFMPPPGGGSSTSSHPFPQSPPAAFQSPPHVHGSSPNTAAAAAVQQVLPPPQALAPGPGFFAPQVMLPVQTGSPPAGSGMGLYGCLAGGGEPSLTFNTGVGVGFGGLGAAGGGATSTAAAGGAADSSLLQQGLRVQVPSGVTVTTAGASTALCGAVGGGGGPAPDVAAAPTAPAPRIAAATGTLPRLMVPVTAAQQQPPLVGAQDDGPRDGCGLQGSSREAGCEPLDGAAERGSPMAVDGLGLGRMSPCGDLASLLTDVDELDVVELAAMFGEGE